MQLRNKPFAPYGDLLHLLRKQNITPNYAVYLYCGRYAIAEARRMLASGQLCLCLPPGTNINDYQWPIYELNVILFDTGEMTAKELESLTFALLAQGAKQVCLYREDLPAVEIYKS